MGADSKISWTHHTFNPWRGCTKVSAGCQNCYAATMSLRNPAALGVWGPRGKRVIGVDSYWRQPVKWNKAAGDLGERHRVFCASLADVFEGDDTMPAEAHQTVREARVRLFDLICRTPHLDWLLLTKRPENALRIMVEAGLYAVENPTLPRPQPNLWIGTSVEDQEAADTRIPKLLNVPAVVRFLSCEPLLGRVCLRDGIGKDGRGTDLNGIGWVIVGGESGAHARPCDVGLLRGIVRQCQWKPTPVFVKQLGARPEYRANPENELNRPLGPMKLRDPKGGDMAEFPSDLRVRQFPAPAGARQ